MMRLLLLLATSLFLLSCDRLPVIGPATQDKLATASQDDCGFVQNSYGQRVSWKQTLPVKMYIDASVPTEYDDVIRDAAKHWEDIVGRTLFTFERIGSASSVVRDGKNILHWDRSWVGSGTSQALTNLSWYSNQLTEADLNVNATNFTYYVSDSTSNRDVHLPSLLVHEFGHVLGLKHVTGTTVMLSVLDYLLQREFPTEEDKAHIKCEYN